MGVYSMESVKGLDHVQVAYIGKDNPIEVILKEDEKEYDFSGANHVKCKIANKEFDSLADADAFDLSEAQIGRLKIYIGEQTGIPAQAHNVKVEVKDANGKTYYFGQIRVKVENPGI